MAFKLKIIKMKRGLLSATQGAKRNLKDSNSYMTVKSQLLGKGAWKIQFRFHCMQLILKYMPTGMTTTSVNLTQLQRVKTATKHVSKLIVSVSHLNHRHHHRSIHRPRLRGFLPQFQAPSLHITLLQPRPQNLVRHLHQGHHNLPL